MPLLLMTFLRRSALPLLFVTLIPILTGCDDHAAPKAAKKLALPKSENTLDELLKKSAALPTPAGHVIADRASANFPTLHLRQRAAETIRLSNDGMTPVTLAALRIAGQSEQFDLGGDCRGGLSLTAGASCMVEIHYQPNQSGAAQADLVVEQAPAGQSLFLPLRGFALPAPEAPSPGDDGKAARHSLSFAGLRQAASLRPAGPESEPTPEHRLQDLDYREAGMPGLMSSLPVERSRVLTADRYIPALLENTINSQLPGRAIAVVERPIFGEDGRLVLIPAGTRVIGNYRSAPKYGQARLDIIWSRMLRPDGGSINLEAEGADIMGRSGVAGILDERLVEKFGSSLLISAIGAAGAGALATDSTVVTSPLGGATQVQSGRTLAANRFGNDSDRLAQRMVEDNIDISPILTVPAGTRLVIIPTEDIWLRDPDHLLPISGPRGMHGVAKSLSANHLLDLLPALIDLLAHSPALQEAAPQTAQQILQSALLQQLRNGTDAPPAPPVAPPAAPPLGASPPGSMELSPTGPIDASPLSKPLP